MNAVRFACLPLSLVACGKLGSIKVSDEATVTVPKATGLETLIGDMGFGEFAEMDLTESSELQNQDVRPGDIQDVYMTVFELAAVDPPGSDLSFLNSMTISVESDGLPAQVIARAEDFPEGQAVVAFELPEVDMTEYVVSEAMTFTNEVNGSRRQEDTQVTARFTVKVGVRGQAIFGGGED